MSSVLTKIGNWQVDMKDLMRVVRFISTHKGDSAKYTTDLYAEIHRTIDERTKDSMTGIEADIACVITDTYEILFIKSVDGASVTVSSDFLISTLG